MAQNVLITPASTKIAFTDSGDTTTVLKTSSGRFEFKDSGESNFVDIYANDIVLDGNLTVGGTTTTVNTSNVLVEDPILQLAKGQTSGSPSIDIGFVGLRGDSNNAAFIWDESADQFAAILTTGDGSATTLTPASYADFKAGVGTFTGNITVGPSNNSKIYMGGNDYIAFTDGVGDGFKFVYDNTERLRITNTGKVLINDTTTTNNNNAQLYVNGPVYGSEFDLPSGGVIDWANGDARIAEGLTSNYSLSLQNYDGSSAMVTTLFLKSGGNVGIGTVAPAAHLHVSKTAGTTTVLTEVAAGSIVGYEIKKTGTTTQHWKIVDGQTVNGVLEFYDATDSATRMAFNTDGNVGIGVVNAPQLLTIKGDSKYFGAYASDGSLSVRLGSDASGDGQLLLADANGTTKVLIEAEASAVNYINNGGSVGIGTNSPAYAVDIRMAAADIFLSSTTGTNRAGFQSANTGGASYFYRESSSGGGALGGSSPYATAVGGSGAYPLQLGTNNAVRMTIDSNGNVGIGTNDPKNKLTITDGATSYTNANVLLQIKRNATNGNDDTSRAAIMLANNSNGFFIAYGGTTDRLRFIDGGAAERITLLNGGNVGIGEIAPEGLLSFKANESNTPKIRFQNQHSVTADAAVSTYDDASGTTILIGSNLYINSSGSTTRFNTGEESAGFRADRGGLLQFYTGDTGATATERMRIGAAGNVSVGSTSSAYGRLFVDAATTAANTALAVRGRDSSADYLALNVMNNADSGLFVIYNSGKVHVSGSVGIGTTSPSQALHVYQTGGAYNALFSNDGQATVEIQGGENSSARLRLIADQGDDANNADHFQLIHETSNNFEMQRYDSGWQWKWKIDSSNNVHQTGTLTIGAFTIPNTDGTANQVLQTNGSGTLSWSSAGTGTVSGSGTDHYIPRFNGTGALQNSSIYADDNGNVGIGTTTPNFPLQVYASNLTNGEAKRIVSLFDATSAAAGTGAGIALGGWSNGTSSAINDFGVIQGIKENGTAGNYASAMLFLTRANGANPTEQMRINSDGNVGIGTTNPSRALHVVGGVYIPSGASGFGTGDTTALVNILGTGANNATSALRVFRQGGDELLRTYNDGMITMGMISTANIGIGTATPGAKLHVNGDAIFEDNGSNINIKNTWSSGNHDINFIGGSSSGGSASNTAARIRVLATAPGGAATGSMQFTVNSGDTFVDAMQILSSGSVGIGTTSPTSQLHVNSSGSDFSLRISSTASRAGIVIDHPSTTSIMGSALVLASDDTYRLGTASYYHVVMNQAGETQLFGGGSAGLKVDTNQNVGIGTTATLTHQLEVAGGSYNSNLKLKGGGASAGILFADSDNNTDGYVYSSGQNIGFLDAGADWMVRCVDDQFISFSTDGGTERMRVNSAGSVGIGTTSPSYKLHVAATTTSLVRFDAGNANNWISVTSGNGYSAGILYENAGTGKWYVGHYNGNADGFSFYDASTSSVPVFIKEGGNFGIGTTAPEFKLQVENTVAAGSDNFILNVRNPTHAADSRAGIAFRMNNNTGSNWDGAGIQAVNDGVTGAGHLTFGSVEDNTYTEHVRIKVDGNVGIGTNNPGQLLEVGNDGNTDYALIGPTKIGGGMGHGNYAGFSHRDMGGTGNYALIQSSSGHTYLNSASGQNLNFRINNSDTMYMSSTALNFNDSKKLILGNDSDLQLFHDGSNSYIQNGSTGSLNVTLNAGTEFTARFVKDAAVELYYNGTKTFETNSTGATVGPIHGSVTFNNTSSVSASTIIQQTYNGGTAELRIGSNVSTTAVSAMNILTGNAGVVQFNGSVGIGTATPGSLLEIYENDSNEGNTQLHIHNDKNDDAAVIKLEGKRTSSNDTAQVLFANSGNGIAAIKALTAGADDGLITFSTSAAGSGSTLTEYMRITSAGSVGIGTSAPGKLLQLEGGGLRLPNGNSIDWNNENTRIIGSHSSNKIQFDVGGVSNVLYLSNGSVGTGTATPNKTLQVTYASTSTNFTEEGLSGGAAGKGLLIHNTQESNSVYANLDFRANNADGRIAYQMQTATNVGDFHFITDNTGSPQSMMTIKNNGNVGIGESSPDKLLHIKGTDTAGIVIENTTNATNMDIDWYNNGGSAAGRIRYSEGTGDFSFMPNQSTNAVTFKYDGKVGIGTSSPAQKLSVLNGKVSVSDGYNIGSHDGETGMYVDADTDIRWQVGGSEKFRIASTGSFGIGVTPNSANKLEVNGQVRGTTAMFGNSATSNVAAQPVHIKYGGPASLRLEDSTSSNLVYDLTSDHGTGFIIRDETAGTNRLVIDQSTGNATFSNDVIITGDLTVNGDATTVNTTNLLVEDPLIVLAKNQTGTPTLDAGIVVERGDSNNAAMYWDESDDQFRFITTTETGSTAGNIAITDNADIKAKNATFTGTLTESSSITLKENIFDFTSPLEKISKVRPVKYNKKTNKDKKEIGLIAEELAEIFPELVENDKDGNPASVNYTRAVTVLFDGFKQMYKELKEIKEKIK